jgi:hypothetical protein
LPTSPQAWDSTPHMKDVWGGRAPLEAPLLRLLSASSPCPAPAGHPCAGSTRWTACSWCRGRSTGAPPGSHTSGVDITRTAVSEREQTKPIWVSSTHSAESEQTKQARISHICTRQCPSMRKPNLSGSAARTQQSLSRPSKHAEANALEWSGTGTDAPQTQPPSCTHLQMGCGTDGEHLIPVVLECKSLRVVAQSHLGI